MRPRSLGASALSVLSLSVACGGDSPTKVNGAIQPGESIEVSGARSLTLEPGQSAGEYSVVVVNTSTTATAAESFSLKGEGITTPLASLSPADAGSFSRGVTAAQSGAVPLTLDRARESRVRERERIDLTSRFASAREWYGARAARASSSLSSSAPLPPDVRRAGAIPATARVGDTLTVNVNVDSSCSAPTYRKARVTAISTRAIVLSDTSNPAGGFTDADFQRFATRFDTLIYPLDVSVFGAPTDIDNNGRIAVIFTVEINRQTPRNATSFTGGITFSRDLFPVVGTARAKPCPTSNEAEAFYLLAPDPLGTINANRRTKGFVDSTTTAVLAHEFQHLINQGRRLYVTNSPTFESTWLDEALAHVAEELLFFREAGLAPRTNLTAADIQAPAARANAFDQDMSGNLGRYREYLQATATSSPYSKIDALSTRGAAYNFLRYLVDHNATTDADVFTRLVNSPDSGTANVRGVFGDDLPGHVRDWSVSQLVDDVGIADPDLLQLSWNWRSVMTARTGSYPLRVQRMTSGSTYSSSAVPGGSVFYTLGVPAGTSATISLGGQSQKSTSLQLVIVRTR